MITLAQAVDAVAAEVGVNQSTVGVIARHLRAARLLPVAGRGPGGARLSQRHMATLIAAVLVNRAGVNAQDVPDRLNPDHSPSSLVDAVQMASSGIVTHAEQFGKVSVIASMPAQSVHALLALTDCAA